MHAFNEDQRRHSKHIRLCLKRAQEDRLDFKWHQLWEEKDLLEAVTERQQAYDWVLLNKNGYRGSINKQRFVGSNTSRVLEQVDCNLIIFA